MMYLLLRFLYSNPMKHTFYMILLLLSSCFNKKVDQGSVLKKRQEHELFLQDIKNKQKLLDRKELSFDGIEVIYIQSGENYYQWFGHSILRLVGSGSSPENDLTVSFIADFNDDDLDVYKAYYGGYIVLPIIKTYKESVHDYLVIEKRYIDRYILPTTASYRNEVLKTLRAWVQDPSLPGIYSFRRNGCTALLFKLLAHHPKIDADKVAFPVEVAPYLEQQGLINYKYERLSLKNLSDHLKSVKPFNFYQE